MNYSWLVPIALFGWIPFSVYLFVRLKARRGLLAIFILGWLLLPVATYSTKGLPPFMKSTSVVLSAMIAICSFDSARFSKLRLSVLDLPMLAWCVIPSISVLANGLPENEALLRIFDQFIRWGLPYLVGRMYFGDLEGIRDLAVGFLLGGLLYVPLCLLEMRLSPQLHSWIYGFHQHTFLQSIREGGYRPVVFLEHGLAVALWMTCAGLVGVWLWQRRVVTRLLGVNVMWLALSVVVVTLMSRSFGAMALLLVALAVLALSRVLKLRVLILALALVPPAYMAVRAPKIWDGAWLVQTSASFNADRGASLATRIRSEDMLCTHALKQPLLGWGGWGRNMNFNRDINGEIVDPLMDGLWVIVIGKFGVLGLAAMTASMLLPVIALVIRAPPSFLFGTSGAPALGLCMSVILLMIDCLFNAMLNPLIVLAAGGIATLATGGFQRGVVPPPRRVAPVRRPLRRVVAAGGSPASPSDGGV